MTDWNGDSDGWPYTPPLDVFRELYAKDDNLWWRVACGHHQNLYEAADDQLVEVQQVLTDLIGELRARPGPEVYDGMGHVDEMLVKVDRAEARLKEIQDE